jgi:diguanylate cyclase (GGDEF)-like protein
MKSQGEPTSIKARSKKPEVASRADRLSAPTGGGSTAEERVRKAAKRDEAAWLRDLDAQKHDRAAEEGDEVVVKLEEEIARLGFPLDAAVRQFAERREQAAADRVRAADDRRHAARDRMLAAEDRDATLTELRRAHLDGLTGAYQRAIGEEMLRAEINRARRVDGRMVLAFVDVVGLKEVNDREGHAAGDALLREAVAAIRSNIRSYEPIVRFGGDEFVCALSKIDLGEASKRFGAINEGLASATGETAISVGLAELRPEDTLDDLIQRADAALIKARARR